MTDDRRGEERADGPAEVLVLDVALDRVEVRVARVHDASASASRLSADRWDPAEGEVVHLASSAGSVPLLCRVQTRRGLDAVLTLVSPAAAPDGMARALGLEPPAAAG